MISLQLARKLKEAGLIWKPVENDFFAIPERGMDQRVFVIDNMPAVIERLFGTPVVAFQGSSEWALDYLIATEAVWLPREDQIRELLLPFLEGEPGPSLYLSWSLAGYQCEMRYQNQSHVFRAGDGSDAYGQALLYILRKNPPREGSNPEEDF